MALASTPWVRTGGELGLRVVSSAASLVLILAIARSVGSEDFIASQQAMILIGLAAIVGDFGLVLHTTRSITSDRTQDIPPVLSTRLVLALLALVAACAFSLQQDPAWLYTLILGPFLLSQVLRNHVFAQVRGRCGVGYELVSGPSANLVDSLIAAAVVFATGSVTLSYTALSLACLPTTALLTLRAQRRAQISMRLGRPSLALLLTAGRAGLAPLGAGAAIKTFGLALTSGPVASALGPATVSWLVACIRALDAASAYVTTRLIVADHARASRGLPVSLLRGVGYVCLAYLLAVLALPVALLGKVPTAGNWLLGLALAGLALLWFFLSKAIHLAHAHGDRSPWWLLVGAHVQLLLPVLAPAVDEERVVWALFLVPALAAGGVLLPRLRREVGDAVTSRRMQAPS